MAIFDKKNIEKIMFSCIFFQFLSIKTLDPDCIRIGTVFYPKMLDPDPESMNPDPKH
jgi:hypothetical protein